MDGIDDIQWPTHAASLHIGHNQHLSYYETVEEAILRGTYFREDFIDEAEIALCIAADSVWTIQWYPNTPVGSCMVAASSLSRALKAATADT